jgi:hypothetical protein
MLMSRIPANSTMDRQAFDEFLADLSVPYNEPSGGDQSSPPPNFWLNPAADWDGESSVSDGSNPSLLVKQAQGPGGGASLFAVSPDFVDLSQVVGTRQNTSASYSLVSHSVHWPMTVTYNWDTDPKSDGR